MLKSKIQMQEHLCKCRLLVDMYECTLIHAKTGAGYHYSLTPLGVDNYS